MAFPTEQLIDSVGIKGDQTGGVSEFHLMYSLDGYTWLDNVDKHGTPVVSLIVSLNNTIKQYFSIMFYV